MNLQEHELMAHLVEELGEATQAAGKLLRFGLDNVNPVTGEKNLDRLQAEIADVLVAVELLAEVRLIDMRQIEQMLKPAKRERFNKWKLEASE